MKAVRDPRAEAARAHKPWFLSRQITLWFALVTSLLGLLFFGLGLWAVHTSVENQVRALCQDLEHYGLAIHVSETNWPAELPGATALTLYRVTQEALHNAAKHSGAEAVWVRLEATDSLLKLTVSDAGVGFEPDLLDRIEGFGMMSMRQRLRGVGGSLLVKSAPGQGTRIQASLPRVLSFTDAETATSDGRRPSLSAAL